jgi:hypothetical protein
VTLIDCPMNHPTQGGCIVGSLTTRAMKTAHAQPRHSQTAEWARRDLGISDNGRCPRTSASSMLHGGDEACLSSQVERLLLDVVTDGFVLYCCGPRTAPRALVASYQWEDYVDLITIRRFDRITTARVPAPQHDRVDVFAPEIVVWAYEGPPQSALRALLDLLPPHHPHAPTSAYPAPPSLRIPRTEQRPMTIQLPPPRRAGNRAARLAVHDDR